MLTAGGTESLVVGNTHQALSSLPLTTPRFHQKKLQRLTACQAERTERPKLKDFERVICFAIPVYTHLLNSDCCGLHLQDKHQLGYKNRTGDSSYTFNHGPEIIIGPAGNIDSEKAQDWA